MRLFTAIDVSEEVRERLALFLDQLRPLANLRWSPAENLHITTKFIGEWPESRLTEIEGALAAIPKPGPLHIQIRSLGWFPNPHRPRVFWAGVEATAGLRELSAATSNALESLGVPAETRDYSPHLTLARVRDGASKEALNAVRRVIAAMDSTDFGAFDAEAQCLYLSAGGTYTKLGQFSRS